MELGFGPNDLSKHLTRSRIPTIFVAKDAPFAEFHKQISVLHQARLCGQASVFLPTAMCTRLWLTTGRVRVSQIEVVYTGGCSAEHLIGSTDDKGSWLDGLLLRRLRALIEGVCGSGRNGGARSRHRACGIGTGDVSPPLPGKATSGFSHGCKSRLLVLDGPFSRLLEGMFAGDHASAPCLTGPQVRGRSPATV